MAKSRTRPGRRRINPLDVAKLKARLRCPECDSTVHVDQNARPLAITVEHDPRCPASAALEARGGEVHVDYRAADQRAPNDTHIAALAAAHHRVTSPPLGGRR